jgi:glycosyltransferase involved in cell wall biosynthesis
MRVNLFTNLTGFPKGTATANRIRMIGKSIQLSSIPFVVYTNYVKYEPDNDEKEGVDDEIRFNYLCRRTKSPFKVLRMLFFAGGLINLFKVLKSFNPKEDIVYIYAHGHIFNLVTLLMCNFFGLKVIQEINEWYHRDLRKIIATYIMERPVMKYSRGVISISEYISDKIRSINPQMNILNVPILEDTSKFNLVEIKNIKNYCFWMGDVDGYLRDIKFILNILFRAKEELDITIPFIVSGPLSSSSEEVLREYCENNNYNFEQNVKLLGFISEDKLLKYCSEAYFFIVPLWDDERSKARFPTKIASFMSSGQPIITCEIGDVAKFLTDEVDVLFFKPDNIGSALKVLKKLLEDKSLYSRIYLNSRKKSIQILDYSSYANDFKVFLTKI